MTQPAPAWSALADRFAALAAGGEFALEPSPGTTAGRSSSASAGTRRPLRRPPSSPS